MLSEHCATITPHTYWAAKKRGPSKRAQRDAELIPEIQWLFDSKGSARPSANFQVVGKAAVSTSAESTHMKSVTKRGLLVGATAVFVLSGAVGIAAAAVVIDEQSNGAVGTGFSSSGRIALGVVSVPNYTVAGATSTMSEEQFLARLDVAQEGLAFASEVAPVDDPTTLILLYRSDDGSLLTVRRARFETSESMPANFQAWPIDGETLFVAGGSKEARTKLGDFIASGANETPGFTLEITFGPSNSAQLYWRDFAAATGALSLSAMAASAEYLKVIETENEGERVELALAGGEKVEGVRSSIVGASSYSWADGQGVILTLDGQMDANSLAREVAKVKRVG